MRLLIDNFVTEEFEVPLSVCRKSRPTTRRKVKPIVKPTRAMAKVQGGIR